MHIDYAGTSPQIDRGINCVLNYTHAYSVYPVKCALDPFTPRNEGSYRAITVAAPEGSILNPRFPAPCSARQLTGPSAGGRDLPGAGRRACPTRSSPNAAARRRCARCSAALDRNGDRFSPGAVRQRRHGRLRRTATACRPRRSRPMSAPAASRRSRASRRCVVWQKQLRPDSGGAGTLPRRPRPGGRDRGALAGAAAAVAAVRPARSSGARRARRRRRRAGGDRVRRRHAAASEIAHHDRARHAAAHASMPAAAAMAIRSARDPDAVASRSARRLHHARRRARATTGLE